MIPLVDLGWQHSVIADEVERGWSEVVAATDFIRGKAVLEFEEAFAEYCRVQHCVGVGSGTDALELSLRALGISAGDKVVVPVNTFIATALAVLRIGAEVVFVDCDPATHLIDVERVTEALDRRVRAVIAVHLFGQMAPMDALGESIGDRWLVEDAAQAQGALQHGARAGSLGVIAGTSFYPGKNIGAYGDGGAVLTSDDDLARRVRALGNWGSSEKYLHPEVGFNSRLDTLQAVVLKAKLARLDAWNDARHEAAGRYDQMLSGIPDVVTPQVVDGNTHVWHLYVVEVPRRDDVATKLRAGGIQVGVHYPLPLHLQGAFRHLGHRLGDFPNAERLSRRILSLPLFPGITARQQEEVVGRLAEALGN